MGYLLAALAEELPQFDIAGYDLNDEKEQFIRANGATDFYSGSLEDIPKKFDLITLNHVLRAPAGPRDRSEAGEGFAQARRLPSHDRSPASSPSTRISFSWNTALTSPKAR